MASGDPGSWLGRMKLDSSSPVPPSGGRSVTISEREFGMPMTVSTNSPSMNILPSSTRPSPTKNAVAASRSPTVMPTWSKRRIADTGALLRQCVRSGSRCCLLPTTSTLVSSETLLVPGICDQAKVTSCTRQTYLRDCRFHPDQVGAGPPEPCHRGRVVGDLIGGLGHSIDEELARDAVHGG